MTAQGVPLIKSNVRGGTDESGISEIVSEGEDGATIGVLGQGEGRLGTGRC